MPRTPNRNEDSGKYARVRKPFVGSNLEGDWEGDYYVVRSYNRPIYIWVNGQWYAERERLAGAQYRHQILARPMVSDRRYKLKTRRELEDLIK